MVYGDAYVIDDNDAVVAELKGVKFNERALIYSALNMPQASVLWRRELFSRVGGVDVTLTYAMDDDLWWRFLQEGARFVYLPGVLSNFRRHPDSKTVRHTGRVVLRNGRILA